VRRAEAVSQATANWSTSQWHLGLLLISVEYHTTKFSGGSRERGMFALVILVSPSLILPTPRKAVAYVVLSGPTRTGARGMDANSEVEATPKPAMEILVSVCVLLALV